VSQQNSPTPLGGKPNPTPEINVSPEVIDALQREFDRHQAQAEAQAQAELKSQAVAPEKPAGKLRRRDTASKGLILLWCFWLMGSWLIISQHDAGFPSFNRMMMSIMVGLVVLWPMYRLSQQHPDSDPRPQPSRKRPFLQFGSFESGYPMRPAVVLSDWLCLNLVLHAILWPVYMGPQWSMVFARVLGKDVDLDLETRWSIQQTLWMGLDTAAWSLMAACLIVLGCRSKTTRGRVLAMVCCLGLILTEPLLLVLVNIVWPSPVYWPMYFTPVQSMWEVAGRTSHWNAAKWVPVLQVTVGFAVACWVATCVYVWRTDRARKAGQADAASQA
jgi:hypothetical protein